MAKKAHVTATSKRRATNAGPCLSPGSQPAMGHQAGIRSLPTKAPWNTTITLQPGRNRQRVATARALDELMPMIGYLNRMLPEEALGNGLRVTSLSKDPDFRKQSNAWFDLWGSSTKIDVRGEVNIYTCQSMLGNYMLRDGEIMSLKVKSANEADYSRSLTDKSFRAIQLQFIRRDQIGTLGLGSPALTGPESIARWDDGVFLDDLDRAVTYRMLKRVNGSITPSANYDVPASRIIHLKEPGLEGIHGSPWSFRGEDCAIDYLDLNALSKYADKIRAAFLGVITTQSGEVPMGMKSGVKQGTKQDPNDPTKTVEDKSIRYYEIAGGVFIPVLKKDESISFFNGQNGMTFGAQLVYLAQQVLLGYGVPPEYISELKTLGSGAIRMILRKVSKLIDRIRRPFENVFLQQCWEMVISDAIARQQLPFVDDWNAIQCLAAPDPTIDAGRDENAEQKKILNFTGTVQDYCARDQKDGETVRHHRIDEIADNISYGAAIRRPGLPNGLPWFLCVDPAVLQAVSGIASNPEIDLANLGKVIKELPKEDPTP